MKKIMFDDRYGLTEAVLSGRKTITRHIVKGPRRFKGCEDMCLEFHKRPNSNIWYDCVVTDGDGRELGQLPLPFEVGDVVAVTQRYETILTEMFERDHGYQNPIYDPFRSQKPNLEDTHGWTNKMFVRADLMPQSPIPI